MNLTNYTVGAELAQKGGFHIANISMLISEEKMLEGEDYLKFGTITLINKASPWLPAYIDKVITESELTCLEGLLPLSYVEDELSEEVELKEYDITKDKDGIEGVQKIPMKNYYSKISHHCTPVTVAKKKFVRIEDEVLLKAFDEKKVRAIMNTTDFPEYDSHVDDYIDLTKDKVLAWY